MQSIWVEESRGIDHLDWLRDSVVEGSELQVKTDIWCCFVGQFHLDKLELNEDNFDSIWLGCIMVYPCHTKQFKIIVCSPFGISKGPFWFSSLPSRSHSVTDLPAKGPKYRGSGTGIHHSLCILYVHYIAILVKFILE